MKAIIILMAMLMFSCVPVKANDTCKTIQTKLINCDSVVKHYADSMKAMYKARRDTIEQAKVLARKQTMWGKTADGKGYIDPFLYLIYMGIALLSLIASTWITVKVGIKNNEYSPTKFSLRYWWHMNHNKIERAIGILIIIFFACRCSNEMFNVNVSFGFALGLGAGIDQLIEVWNNYKQKKIDAFKKTLGIETITQPIPENK